MRSTYQLDDELLQRVSRRRQARGASTHNM